MYIHYNVHGIHDHLSKDDNTSGKIICMSYLTPVYLIYFILKVHNIDKWTLILIQQS